MRLNSAGLCTRISRARAVDGDAGFRQHLLHNAIPAILLLGEFINTERIHNNPWPKCHFKSIVANKNDKFLTVNTGVFYSSQGEQHHEMNKIIEIMPFRHTYF